MPQLSALTPPVVDHLFGIDTAEPVAAPLFIFIVGVPGAGKSSVPRRLPGGHATINLDILLEAIEPFRAASAIAHALKSDERTREKISFASIFGYGTRKENLGMFNWYDRVRPTLDSSEELGNYNTIRARFRPLHGESAPETIIQAAAAALQRAIDRHINIVYETTLGRGKTTKVDEIMTRLPPTYRVSLYHVFGPAAEVADRIYARQEYSMPYDPAGPFYRYVKTDPVKIQEQLEENRKGVVALRRKYEASGAIQFHEVETRLDPARLPPARAASPRAQRNRIVGAYGTRRRHRSSSLIPSSLKLSSSNTFRLTSSSSSEKRRRTRKNI